MQQALAKDPPERSTNVSTVTDRSARTTRRVADDAEDVRPKGKAPKKQPSRARGRLWLVVAGGCLLVAMFGVVGFVWPGLFLANKNVVAQANSGQGNGEPRSRDDRPDKIIANAPEREGNQSVRSVMIRLFRGPESLGNIIKGELEGDPDWDSLRGHSREYLELATTMAAQNAPRGSKESWTALTASFSDAARDLDKSVQAKNKESAMTAYESLSSSCMACHREHRGGPKGFGPKGGGLGGFGPKKGPPPEGFN